MIILTLLLSEARREKFEDQSLMLTQTDLGPSAGISVCADTFSAQTERKNLVPLEEQKYRYC